MTDAVYATELRCWDNATPCWYLTSQYTAHLLQDPRHAAQMRGRADVVAIAAAQACGATKTLVVFALAAAWVLLTAWFLRCLLGGSLGSPTWVRACRTPA